MKMNVFIMSISAVLLLSCGVKESSKAPTTENGNMQSKPSDVAMTNKEKAVANAKQDAVKAGFSLKIYEIVVSEEPKQWGILFQLKDKTLTGGGPEYVIDKETGKIIDRKFHQ